MISEWLWKWLRKSGFSASQESLYYGEEWTETAKYLRLSFFFCLFLSYVVQDFSDPEMFMGNRTYNEFLNVWFSGRSDTYLWLENHRFEIVEKVQKLNEIFSCSCPNRKQNDLRRSGMLYIVDDKNVSCIQCLSYLYGWHELFNKAYNMPSYLQGNGLSL